jgi:hypothetical protein
VETAMSILTPHFNAGPPRKVGGKGFIAHLVKGFAPNLVLIRLSLSALAGVLAFHFWKNGRR